MMQELPAGLSEKNLALVRPIATSADAVLAWQEFQAMKRALLDPHDYQDMQGRPTIKKSGWRKLATAFGISTQVMTERRTYDDEAGLLMDVVVRAIAPNGRFAEACGTCSQTERKFSHLEHDVRATAQTRATNRAISDLIGGGEVSYEELAADERARPARPVQRAVYGGASPPADAPDADGGVASAQQVAAIRAHGQRTGYDLTRLLDEANVSTLEQLSRADAAAAVRILQRLPNAETPTPV